MTKKFQKNDAKGKESVPGSIPEDSSSSKPNDSPKPGQSFTIGDRKEKKSSPDFLYYLSTRCCRMGRIVTPLTITEWGKAYQFKFKVINLKREEIDWVVYLPQSAVKVNSEAGRIQVHNTAVLLALNAGFHVNAWPIPEENGDTTQDNHESSDSDKGPF